MQKLDMQTYDSLSNNIEIVAKLFPQVITEKEDSSGNIIKAIDFDLFKALFTNELVEDNDERYRLDWPGKKASILKANTPIQKTLRPVKEDSVNFDTTENLYIEGDNFEVLKILQESYLGKVKMIYIDPPYNTGKDFVYRDNFKVSKDEYEEELGTTDEEGGKLFRNTDTNGRFHSDWLSMMYERLILARDLLKDDGVIFMSIDDNEVFNLKKICDEIYGEENFINIISAKMKNVAGASGGGEDKRLKKNIEYIIVYVKNYESFENFNAIYNRTEISEVLNYYKENNISWKYTAALVFDGDKEHVGNTFDGDGNDIKIYKRNNFIIKSIGQIMKDEELTLEEVYSKYFNRIFRTTIPQSSIRVRVMKKIKELNINNDFYSIEYIPKSGKNKGKIYEQFYKGDKFNLFAWFSDVGEKEDNNVFKTDKLGTLWDKIDLNNLSKEGDIKFENGKKPVKLLKNIINMCSSGDDLILDFFSGSASTGHACIEQNLEDGNNRKFIMVQIPELIDKEEYIYKEGFRNICEIGKERIRRAGKKIVEENKDKLIERETLLDTGFRVYKVDSSNMKDVYYHPTEITQGNLFDITSNIKEDRTSLDLLTQVMIDSGITLDLPIESKTIAGNEVFFVAGNSLVACFDEYVDFSIVDEIAKLEPLKVVFRDSSFRTDSDRINFETKFKKLSPESVLRVL